MEKTINENSPPPTMKSQAIAEHQNRVRAELKKLIDSSNMLAVEEVEDTLPPYGHTVILHFNGGASAYWEKMDED